MTKPKERSPAMQFYFRQFSGDEAVAAMDLDAIGAHILLMCYAGGSRWGYKIEFDEQKVRRVVRSPSDDTWARIWPQILEAWKPSSDRKWLIQDGMKRTLLKQKDFSRRQSERANGRWKDATRDAKRVPDGMLQICSSSSSTTSSSNNNKPLAPEGELFLIFPPKLNNDSCRQAWQNWLDHKKSKGQKYKSIKTQQQALKNWADKTADEFCKAVAHSIGANYSGIFAAPIQNGAKPFVKDIKHQTTTWKETRRWEE